LRPSDARRVPWKNGRGFTDELALWPSGASFEKGEFDWRISKAAVEESGPFSLFPGFERVLVVTAGAGLVLDHGGQAPRTRLERHVPYRFSGDWPTSAALIDGRVEDFNVLCRRGAARAEVDVWPAGPQRSVTAARDEHVFVHYLASGESLWLQRGIRRELELHGAGTALLVRILAR
jgi:environmental stress-induced protein Ves